MLTTEPLLSIDVHNMRENPSLVPEKMVAFKIKATNKRRKRKNFGQSALGAKRSPSAVKSVSAACRQGRGTP